MVNIWNNLYLPPNTVMGEGVVDRNWHLQPIPSVESSFIGNYFNYTLLLQRQAVLQSKAKSRSIVIVIFLSDLD